VTGQTLREEVSEVLGAPRLKALLSHDLGRDADGRAIFSVLGPIGLLAPSWDYAIGGRGTSHSGSSEVFRSLAAAGVPDTQILLSVHVCGGLIREFGTTQQVARFLPDIAAGRRFWSFLVSEESAGSDVTAIASTARPHPGGYLLFGNKRYALKCSMSDYALCLARVEGAEVRGALTVFIVLLSAPGVSVNVLPSMADEQFHDVSFDNVFVADADVLGSVGDGLQLVSSAVNYERSGLDYLIRSDRWIGQADDLARALGPHEEGRLQFLRFRQTCARHIITSFESRLAAGLDLTEIGALSKYANSVVARDAAFVLYDLSCQVSDCRPTDDVDRRRSAAWSALREAPGLIVSAGVSEVLLDTIFAFLDPADKKSLTNFNCITSNVSGAFYRAVTAEPARIGDPAPHLEQLRGHRAFHVCAAAEFGGLNLTDEFGLIASFAAGEAAVAPHYLDAATVMDMLGESDKHHDTIAFARSVLADATAIAFPYRLLERIEAARVPKQSVAPCASPGRALICRPRGGGTIDMRLTAPSLYESRPEIFSRIWQLPRQSESWHVERELTLTVTGDALERCRVRDSHRRGAYLAGLTLGSWNAAMRHAQQRVLKKGRQADLQVCQHELADAYCTLFGLVRWSFLGKVAESRAAHAELTAARSIVRGLSRRLIHLHGASGLLAENVQAIYFGLIHACS
jgi:alkylation response protein AidB-like acyl-CoA dehydrogenase